MTATGSGVPTSAGAPQGSASTVCGRRSSGQPRRHAHQRHLRSARKIGDQEQKAYPFESPQAVSGLGEQALFSKTSSGTPVSVLAVLKGKAQIALFYSGPGDRLALLTSLARRALARI